MKKKIQKYLSGEREGFSLVELIIVIAIMAILIGIIALAVIPYLEKSRKGKDQQTVDTVFQAFQTTIADQKISSDLTVTIKKASGGSCNPANDDFLKAMAEALSCKDAAAMSALSDKLESKNIVDGDITCTYDSTSKEIKVTTADSDIKSSNKSS